MKKKKTGGIILNPYCSIHCLFCGSKRRVTGDELREQEILVLKNLEFFKSEGIEEIEISGSDPLEYEKIVELIEYIKEEGFSSVRLSTNGVRLSDPVFFNELISSGLNAIRIPIYGSESKIHDSVTQTPGSFDDVTVGIRNLIEKTPEIKIQLSCLIMKQNRDDLCKIVDFVSEMGIKDLYFSIPCLAQDNYDDFYIPLRDLKPYVKKLYNYVRKTNDSISFIEMPFCLFGDFNLDKINNSTTPPNLGKYNQPPEKVRTTIPDLPSYRIKSKLTDCNGCRAFNHCDGFFLNDIKKFGIDKIKKIK